MMREAISRLSEREQTILHLVHVEELQGAEIGARLGVSESRVSQILASRPPEAPPAGPQLRRRRLALPHHRFSLLAAPSGEPRRVQG